MPLNNGIERRLKNITFPITVTAAANANGRVGGYIQHDKRKPRVMFMLKPLTPKDL
jgi:hypothetical protein